MIKCQSHEADGDQCVADATVTVFWPGQTTESCDRHFKGQLAVADAMGFRLDSREIIKTEEKS